MITRIALIIAIVSLTIVTSTAEAAKGMKKANQGQQIVSGVVVNIVPDKTGYGVFHVRTAQHHKKNIAANGVAAAIGNQQNQQVQHFNVTSATQFEHHSGSSVNIVNVMALQKGQRVRVVSTGQHAQQVHIYTSAPHMHGNVMRYRTHAYHPHLHHRYR